MIQGQRALLSPDILSDYAPLSVEQDSRTPGRAPTPELNNAQWYAANLAQIIEDRRAMILDSDSDETDPWQFRLRLVGDDEVAEAAQPGEPEQAGDMVIGQLDLLSSILEPIDDVTDPENLRARAKRVWNRAGDFVRGLQVNGLNTLVLARDQQSQETEITKKKVIAVAASTLIVASIAYVSLKHGHHVGVPGHLAGNKAPVQPVRQLHALVPRKPEGLGRLQPNVMNHLPHTTGITVKPAPKPIILTIKYSGDGIEKEAAQYLQQNNYAASTPNINHLTAAILHAQHMSWMQAHFVHVGQHLKAPGRVLKTLSKLKKTKSH